ncbi:MAG: hypothetical protein ACXAC8_09620 [Candidatus Hodarchaeales archaeon]
MVDKITIFTTFEENYTRKYVQGLILTFMIIISISLMLDPSLKTFSDGTIIQHLEADPPATLDDPIRLNTTVTNYDARGNQVLSGKSESEMNQEPVLDAGKNKMSIKASTLHPLSADEKRLVDLDGIMTFSQRGGSMFEYNGTTFSKSNEQIPGKTNWWWHNYGFTDKDVMFWEANFQDVDSGDIDNDGLDEVVISGVGPAAAKVKELLRGPHDDYYWPFETRILTFDDVEHNFALLNEYVIPHRYIDHSTSWHKHWFLGRAHAHRFDENPYVTAIALGNPDTETYGPAPNWLGVMQHRAGGSKNHNYMWIFRWSNTTNSWSAMYNSGVTLLEEEYQGLNGNTDDYFSVDCEWGNFDGDREGNEEFVATTNMNVLVFDWDTDKGHKFHPYFLYSHRFGADWPGWHSLQDSSIGFRDDYQEEAVEVKLVTGNFDADKNLEFAVHTNRWLYIFDWDFANRYRLKSSHKINYLNQAYGWKNTDSDESQLLSLDTNQDGIDEILVIGRTWGNAWCWITFQYNPATQSYERLLSDYNLPYQTKWATTGDVDSDGIDEVVIRTPRSLVVVEVNSTTGGYDLARTAIVSPDLTGSGRDAGPVICGNFNGDGMTLSYTGTYIQEESTPSILVAMAAPPTQVGISQSYGNSYTSYGTAKGKTASETNSIGFSVSTQVGFDVDLPWGISFSGSRVWNEEFEESEFEESSIEVATYSTGGASGNTIIYFQVTFKRYLYTIIEHPFDNSVLGKQMTISIPDNPIVYSVSQEYFNQFYAQNSNLVPVIGDETFTHTIGHPETYPTGADADSNFILPSEFEKSVGQGDQFDSIVITKSEETGFGSLSTTSSEWSGQVSPVVSVGKTKGESESQGYSISVNEECIIEGRVGQISDSVDYCTFQYRWGMFMYPKTHPVTGNTYLVINYYVLDAFPYYPETIPTTTLPTYVTTSFAPGYLIVATIIAVTALKHKKKSKEL